MSTPRRLCSTCGSDVVDLSTPCAGCAELARDPSRRLVAHIAYEVPAARVDLTQEKVLAKMREVFMQGTSVFVDVDFDRIRIEDGICTVVLAVGDQLRIEDLNLHDPPAMPLARVVSSGFPWFGSVRIRAEHWTLSEWAKAQIAFESARAAARALAEGVDGGVRELAAHLASFVPRGDGTRAEPLLALRPMLSAGEPLVRNDGTVEMVPLQLFRSSGGMIVLRVGRTTLWWSEDGRFDGSEHLVLTDDADVGVQSEVLRQALAAGAANRDQRPERPYFTPGTAGWHAEVSAWPEGSYEQPTAPPGKHELHILDTEEPS